MSARARARAPRACAVCPLRFLLVLLSRVSFDIYTRMRARTARCSLLVAHCLPACLPACLLALPLPCFGRGLGFSTPVHTYIHLSLFLSPSLFLSSIYIYMRYRAPGLALASRAAAAIYIYSPPPSDLDAPRSPRDALSLSLPSFLPRPRQSPYLHSTRARPVRIWRARSQVGLAVHQQRSVSCSCSAIVHCRRESGPPRACI